MHETTYVAQLLDLFKAIGDPLRLRLFTVLAVAAQPLCVCELVDIVRRPQYAVSRALGQLRRAGAVSEERRGKLSFYEVAAQREVEEIADLVRSASDDEALLDRDRLRWRLELREQGECVITYTAGYSPPEYLARDDADRSVHARERPRVLFVCVHNSARSQFAEEYLRRYAGDLFEAESAGLEPGEINPHVAAILASEGIDISTKQTRSVLDVYRAGHTYSYVVTVCSREAEENCPTFPGPVRRLNWPFSDPSELTGSEEEIRRATATVGEQIRQKVIEFADEYRASEEEHA